MRTWQDKMFLAVIYGLGAVAMLAFGITKNAGLFAWATSGDYRYGDLYRLCQVRTFKPSAPLPTGPFTDLDSLDQSSALNKNEVMLLGDSFSFCDWGQSPFPMQLSQGLGQPVFSVYNNHHRSYVDNPFTLLEHQKNIHAPKVIVYEIVERLISSQFSSAQSTNSLMSETPPHGWNSWADNFFANTEQRHEALIAHSFLTAPIVSLWKSAAFDLFKQMPPETPLYSVRPPFLFYRDEVTSFQTMHDDQSITQLADNIALLNRKLSERFNCTLVFLPVPNKITLYSRLATRQPYDEFLPRLCQALKNRGVCVVEVLEAFKQESPLIYWPTDTHWNNLGIKIAVEETLKQWPQPLAQPQNRSGPLHP